MTDTDNGQTSPPRLNAAFDLAAAVIAGWLLAQGGDVAVMGLVALAFLAVNAFAPPRLRTRLHVAVVAAISAILLADVFINQWPTAAS